MDHIVFDYRESVINKAVLKAWPPGAFSEMSDPVEMKLFYDRIYKDLQTQLIAKISQGSKLGWMIEAAVQLEGWSIAFQNERGNFTVKVNVPKGVAPAARYGWRYVIDVLMAEDLPMEGAEPQRPFREDVAEALTLLMGMAQAAELSNYIYYFPEIMVGGKLVFSPTVLFSLPSFSKEGKAAFDRLRNAIQERPPWDDYEEFSVDSAEIQKEINAFLAANFGFDLDEAFRLIELVSKNVCEKIGRSMIVRSEAWVVDQVVSSGEISREKVRAILDFSLMRKDLIINSRDFLKKSDQIRMLNYGGMLVDLNPGNPAPIIKSFFGEIEIDPAGGRHIVTSPLALAEWMDNFKHRLLFGMREDLKALSSKVSSSLGILEEYYHRTIFENKVESIFQEKGFETILSLKKINGSIIACGEIDLLAFDKSSGNLCVVEVKILYPSSDIKMVGNEWGKLFGKRGYHARFLEKIEWVKNNLDIVGGEFLKRRGIAFSGQVTVSAKFITSCQCAFSGHVKEYEILPFYKV